MAEQVLLRKISTAEVCGKLDQKEIVATLEKSKKPLYLYSVAGVVTSLTKREGKFGTETKFLGDFFATRKVDGKLVEYKSANAYLPEPINSQVEAALQRTPTVNFSGHVEVVADASRVGYHYNFVPVQKIADADQIGGLAAELLKSLKS